LAQPKIVIKNIDRHIVWRHEYPDIKNHLKVEACVRKQTKNLLTPKPMYYDHVFVISITKLLPHIYILESVTRRSDGYMAKLEKNTKTCNQNLTMQYTQIYDTKLHD
jgi:hypothetical protein